MHERVMLTIVKTTIAPLGLAYMGEKGKGERGAPLHHHHQSLLALSPFALPQTDKFASWVEQVSGGERQHRQMDDRRAHIMFHLPPLSFTATPLTPLSPSVHSPLLTALKNNVAKSHRIYPSSAPPRRLGLTVFDPAQVFA